MRSRSVIVALFVLMFGLFAFLNVLSNSRISALHGSDIVKMIAAGLCFGVGAVLLLQRILPGGTRATNPK